VSGTVKSGMRKLLSLLANTTCLGKPASSIYNCITQPTYTICSNNGICNSDGTCRCNSGYEGPQCQNAVQNAINVALVASLATIIPVVVVVFLVLILLLLAMFIALTVRKKQKDSWEITFEELEMGEPVGTGGYVRWSNRGFFLPTLLLQLLRKRNR